MISKFVVDFFYRLTQRRPRKGEGIGPKGCLPASIFENTPFYLPQNKKKYNKLRPSNLWLPPSK